MVDEESKAEELDVRIRRILVALDSSTHSLAALEAAARLASELEAKLLGLYVEDVNLLRLASLPFAREVSRPTATERTLTEGGMERDLRLRASQCRRALAMVAEQVELEWSFKVVRGAVTQEVLNASLEADLLSLGRASRPLTRRVRLGSTAQAVVTLGSRPVLLARQGADLGQSVIVTYDGSEAADKALASAAQMARTLETNVTVLIMAQDVDVAADLAGRANRRLESRVAHSDYRYLQGNDSHALVQAIQDEECGLVVLGGEGEVLQGSALQDLLDELDCPVMLVR